jgi:3-methyl-2-oxobutanoate hydroxymethyltransferase
MRSGHVAKFVQPYADLRGVLLDATRRYAADVIDGVYPDSRHSY